jgi:hypothetical protein
MVEVHLLRVPVQAWVKAQEHADELLREFALMTSTGGAGASVPARLVELVETLQRAYSELSTEQVAQLWAAAEAGAEELERLTYAVPTGVAEGCVILGDLLDEADDYCRAGEHLLTLTTPQEQVRFRRWYLDQFVTQIGGAPPVPWPEYASADAH